MSSPPSRFPRGRLIAHAGGAVNGKKYTNSVEAFERSAQIVSLIEHDICDASDGLIVAHDGMEHAYGIKGSFSDCTTENFSHRKFTGTLCPMTVRDLMSKLQNVPVSVVLDIKTAQEKDYPAALSEIMHYCSKYGVLDQTIVQIYSIDDFNTALELGFPNVILALWKNFSNVWTQECRNCVDYCFDFDHTGFRALSIAARHFWRNGSYIGEKLEEYAFNKTGSIFLHGQPAEAEAVLLERGFGLFTHHPEALANYCPNTDETSV